VLESGYTPPEDPTTLTFGTYWVPFTHGSLATPARNAVEAAVQRMATVVEGVLDVRRMAGAEWWLQDVDELDPPKEFHTDVNIQVRTATAPHRGSTLRSAGEHAARNPIAVRWMEKTTHGSLTPSESRPLQPLQPQAEGTRTPHIRGTHCPY